MDAVFRNHIVICGWNRRGRALIETLRGLRRRPVLVVHEDIDVVLKDVRDLEEVFLVAGDPSQQSVLLSVDARTAHSVIVLALDSLAEAADARSVEIALAVEKLNAAIYTVIEVRDIRNKPHFAWTKVDDLVADQEIAVCMVAQGIRHLANADSGEKLSRRVTRDKQLLSTYHQLVDPRESRSQLFRIDLPWSVGANVRFQELIAAGANRRVLPVAFVGFRRHEVPDVAGGANELWRTSWKTDTLSNPPGRRRACEIWPEWPADGSGLGVLVIARSLQAAEEFRDAICRQER